ncbi:MAG: glycosyltransferase family 2 protein [Clostridia bacterium]
MKYNNLISIVIPVYNVQGEYLEKCIKSIVEQDEFNDVEVIAVNDGSTLENCLKQLEILRKDNRVKIIDKPNGGVSSARNIGIEQSSGEYILFVDGDDFLEVDCLKKMKEVIKKEKFDIMFFKNSIYYSDTGESKKNIDTEETIFCKDKENLIRKSILCQDYLSYNIGTPWAKLIKSKFLKENHILYNEELTNSEDRVFMFACLSIAEEISFFDYSGYIYNENQYSVCKVYNVNFWQELTKAYEAMENNLEKYKYGKYIDLLKCSKINFFYTYMKLDVFHKDNKIKLSERFKLAKKIEKNIDFGIAKKYKEVFSKKRQFFNNLFRLKLNMLVYISFFLKSN